VAHNESDRWLILVPIIHTQEDMGQLRDSVRRLYIQRHGQKQWDEHLRVVEARWREIRQRIETLDLAYDRVRLYQDGLPVCGHEEAIVRDLAHAGSINHRLLVDLIAKGARLVGTESPQLLIEEYDLARRLLGGPGAPALANTTAFGEQSRKLLDQRDQFIADRINQTLQPGEIGLIFLGMLHNLDGHLAPDLHLTRLESGDASGLSSHSRVNPPCPSSGDPAPAALSESEPGSMF
jgi:hypothetical protein